MNEQNEIRGDEWEEVQREREDALANMPQPEDWTDEQLEDAFQISLKDLRNEVQTKPTFSDAELHDDFEPVPEDDGDWR